MIITGAAHAILFIRLGESKQNIKQNSPNNTIIAESIDLSTSIISLVVDAYKIACTVKF
jgi:hypothetical protein